MVLVTMTACLFMLLLFLGVFGYSIVIWRQSATKFLEKSSAAHSGPQQIEDFSNEYRNLNLQLNVSQKILREQIALYKSKLFVELRRSHIDNAKAYVLQGKTNLYHVKYRGPKISNWPRETDGEKIVCDVPKMRMITRDEFPLADKRHLIPQMRFEDAFGFHNTCAVVTNSGSLLGSRLGAEIDKHDVVLRFNNAPTLSEYMEDVGQRTTIRIVNSQVLAKAHFRFLESSLYSNVTLVAWDPCKYNDSLRDWVQHPEFNLFPSYWNARERNPSQSFYLLHPQSLWDAWNFLNRFTPGPVLKHPPSSGFIGILLLLGSCQYVDIYEYLPSMGRQTSICRYYDSQVNSGCTFGDWHPLAASKLLVYRLQSAHDLRANDF